MLKPPWVTIAVVFCLSLLPGCQHHRKLPADLSFMGADFVSAVVSSDKVQVLVDAKKESITGMEVSTRLPIDEVRRRATTYLTAHGYSRSTFPIESWWYFERPNGDAVCLIPPRRSQAKSPYTKVIYTPKNPKDLQR